MTRAERRAAMEAPKTPEFVAASWLRAGIVDEESIVHRLRSQVVGFGLPEPDARTVAAGAIRIVHGERELRARQIAGCAAELAAARAAWRGIMEMEGTMHMVWVRDSDGGDSQELRLSPVGRARLIAAGFDGDGVEPYERDGKVVS